MAEGMDERLGSIEARYEELQRQLSAPDVAQDPDRLRRLGKAYAELGDIVLPWREYMAARQQAEEARALAKAEADPDMAAYFREEADAAADRAEVIRRKLEGLL